MLIGMGGGSASSMTTGSNTADLDFDSVQRGNAEIQRRAQEVIDRCWALGGANRLAGLVDMEFHPIELLPGVVGELRRPDEGPDVERDQQHGEQRKAPGRQVVLEREQRLSGYVA